MYTTTHTYDIYVYIRDVSIRMHICTCIYYYTYIWYNNYIYMRVYGHMYAYMHMCILLYIHMIQ